MSNLFLLMCKNILNSLSIENKQKKSAARTAAPQNQKPKFMNQKSLAQSINQ